MAETIKGLNIKLGLDATELNSQMSKLKSSLKEQQADLKAINTKLRYDSSNVDLWKQKQDILNRTLGQSEDKLKLLNEKLKESKKALQVGAISEEEFNKVKRSVTYAEADVLKLNNQLEQTSKAINNISNAKWGTIGKIGSTLTKAITLPAIAGATALQALTLQSIQTVDDIGDNAQKVHLSAEAYQEWSYAAQILAVDQDKLQKAFIKVNGIIGSIANGDIDNVNKKLAVLGLTANDLKGLNTEQAFDKIRNAISKLSTESEKAAVTNAIFGERIGADLVQVLNASEAEINALKEEARELGIVTTEDTEMAGAFNDSLDRLKLSFKKIQFELAKVFIPLLEKVVSFTQKQVLPTIQKWIDGWNSLSDSTKKMVAITSVLMVSIGPLLTVIAKIVPMIGAIKTAFTATAGAVTIAGTAVKLSTLGWVGLVAAIGLVLLQNEKFRALLKRLLSIIGELMKTLGGLVVQLIDSLMPIVDVIVDVLNEVIDVAVELIEKLLVPIQKIIKVVVELIEELTPLITEIVNELMNALIPIIDALLVILDPVIDIIMLVVDLVTQVIDVVMGLIVKILKPLKSLISTLTKVIRTAVDVVVKVVDILSTLLKPILEIIAKLLEPILKIVNVLIEAISKIFDALMPLIETVLQPLSGLLDFISGVLTAIEPLLLTIADVIESVISPVLEVLFTILEPILTLLNGIIDAITWVVESIAGILGSIFGDVDDFSTNLQGSVGGAFDFVGGKAKAFFSSLGEFFKGFVSWISNLAKGIADFFVNVFQSFTNWLGGVVNKVANGMKKAWETVKGWFWNAVDTVGGWFQSAGETISGWFGDVGDWFSDTFNLNPKQANQSTTNNSTTNNVTINTTASTFDVDSVNQALGGEYL